ncbi:murein biosynthesis integral membrane protein MurJ [Candidatus Hydrogenosomobacter endosymbioticus]|uniref:Probable lipid II flippase MurJ n=1 Tax=Candidatus Hydrogenosomobacter endosymbioticus TaxID=2558174 RepID=A0ABN6L630_9PROT|nr:murein biosynthesis integral membrane protein MurJ [Candidatus Hydrogenosomobacter endosymbioticus]BDB95956.1 putative lipid II flippase MurJ [Candidatus Hydrogenosomobacter endosymbioticus]
MSFKKNFGASPEQKEVKINFLRSMLSVSGVSVLCRMTGYMRDLLIANFIGVNSVSDALMLAIRAPSFFRRIFGEGAFHVSFLPIFTKLIKGKSVEENKEAFEFAGAIMTVLALSLIACVALITYYFSAINHFIFSDMATKQPETFELYNKFGTITLSFVFFISMSSFFGSILNSFGKFGAYASAQMIGNLTVIAFVLALLPLVSDIGVLFSFAILISGVFQCLWVLVACYWSGYHIGFRIPRWNGFMKKFALNIGPGALGVGVIQLNLVIGAYLAASLPKGSISCLSYADRINQLPLSIIGMSLSSVLLPLLSQQAKSKNVHAANRTQNNVVKLASFLTFPVAVLFIGASYSMVHAFFGYGKVTQNDLSKIAAILAAFGVGAPAYVLMKIFNVRFFSEGNTKVPLYASCLNLVVNIVLGVWLMKKFGCVGIAAASCCSSWSSVFFLVVILYSRGMITIKRSVGLFFLRLAGSCAAMGFVLIAVNLLIGQLVAGGFTDFAVSKESSLVAKSLMMTFVVSAGVVSFVFFSLYFRVTSVRQIKAIAKSMSGKPVSALRSSNANAPVKQDATASV